MNRCWPVEVEAHAAPIHEQRTAGSASVVEKAPVVSVVSKVRPQLQSPRLAAECAKSTRVLPKPSPTSSAVVYETEDERVAWGPSFGLTPSHERHQEKTLTSPLSSWYLSKGQPNFVKCVTPSQSLSAVTTGSPAPRRVNAGQQLEDKESLLYKSLAERNWREWYGQVDKTDLLDPALPDTIRSESTAVPPTVETSIDLATPAEAQAKDAQPLQPSALTSRGTSQRSFLDDITKALEYVQCFAMLVVMSS